MPNREYEPRNEEQYRGRDERERWGRGEWSPYDRYRDRGGREDFREHSFGYGGMDRGFYGGGYGGYGRDEREMGGWEPERGYGYGGGYQGYGGGYQGHGGGYQGGGYGMGGGYMGGPMRGYDRGYGGGMGGYDRNWGEGGDYRYDRNLSDYRRGGFGGGVGGMDLGWEHRGYRGGPGMRAGMGNYDRQFYDRWTDRRGRAPRSYQRSDERIKEDICDRLMGSWIDAEEVDIQVRGGEVMLTGTVRQREEKRGIEDIAEQVLGVKDVQNQIRVQREEQRGMMGREGAAPGQSTQSQSKKPSA